jgi:hypothetical protein
MSFSIFLTGEFQVIETDALMAAVSGSTVDELTALIDRSKQPRPSDDLEQRRARRAWGFSAALT